ncbi:Na,H/K antiporter P-type ATPase alpha subunit family protein (macronuclear) [Tetrahymena thermophila SB210]|uniref:Na,H/K antiporter P-type ATPase alpha subunit family protein n=1 Tax=Tetrahymena thermophila (strain SB210) TaxID=312017 RepID=Q23EX6_TETTS|nr:Na,H/K antiporter P-type ATPase alpha subunit family protein [Tetrahymena thermophila SB210]EAR95129.1 Na,H/K antiporter P-type ATPase alpha subunit family protein [Tetrahymena thermophila SB210]|eukprot:XP_001015374.1 Na,H/K antiporter P-type ATPase alpha subunit family protein [Tetrahymena thermophila SB210]
MNTSDINKSVVRQFEMIRQSIELANIANDRRASVVRSSVQDIKAKKHSLENSCNKVRHVNEEVEEIQIKFPKNVSFDNKAQTPQNNPKIEQQNQEEKVVAQVEGQFSDHHVISLQELQNRLGTNFEMGLSQQQAHELNLACGDNKLTPPKKTPTWIKFIKEILHGFAILLWIGAFLSFLAYGLDESDPANLYLGIIIVIVIFMTGGITFMQNAKSEALMESFKNLMPQDCIVIRDGKELKISAEKLVVGDVVRVKSGDKVPADIRILTSNEMKVDNSPFTGETEPLLRTTECSNLNPLETNNLAFFGTLCKEGQGKGVVINIGDQTMLGMISNLSSIEKQVKTPLRQELDRFVLYISFIAVFLAILLFVLALFVSNQGVFHSLLLGIGILVANVPEGLLGSVTISLVITAKRLHNKNVLVKNLEAVETLGSTSCICSDKTGTLTQNVMTVEHMWYDRKTIRAVNKSQIASNKVLEYNESEICFRALHQAAIISSEAKFDTQGVKDQSNINWIDCPTTGDATETGLIRFYQYIESIDKTRSKYVVPKNKDGADAKMPFNSSCKFALTVVEEQNENSEYCAYIKGAPEKIWTFCKYLQTSQGSVQINSQISKEFKHVNLQFGKSGERVLGFAKLQFPKRDYPKGFQFNLSNPQNFNFQLEGFTFVGLVSLIDPPKPTVPASILECRSAGVKVIMVTGDQPPTATEIARQVNIIPRGVKTVDEIAEERCIDWYEAIDLSDAIVVHGDRIVECIQRKIDEDGNEDNKFYYLQQWVQKPYCVFARTTPAQKLQIVQACQSVGFICAVTGDGVNDSPAIKQADIGISMNLSGSDVTKDAADMILLNDDFSSIVTGIEEGRKIFDNIKKTIIYILTSNIPELIPFVAFIILRIPLAITNIYMICIDIGTDILPSLSLGYEEAEIDIMTRRPRKKFEHLVSNKVIFHGYVLMGAISVGSGFAAFYTTMNHFGFPILSLFGLSTIYVYEPNLSFRQNSQFSDQIKSLAYSRREHDTIFPRAINPTDLNLAINPYYNQFFMYLDGQNSCRYDLNVEDASGKNAYTYSQIDWVKLDEGKKDLRTMLVYCDEQTDQWTALITWSMCDTTDDLNKSPLTDLNACYTTDALKYGQTAWFIAVVFFQWTNIFAVKSRKLSFVFTPFNKVMISGLVLETFLCILISEVPGFQDVFGGRPLAFWQWGIPSFPFTIFYLIWEETRKYLIRTNKWFEKWSLW